MPKESSNYRRKRSSHSIIGVDLFAGAGGMSLGATWAGIDVQLAIELDQHSALTYGHNHPKTKLRITDIRDVKSLDGIDDIGKRILFGGPPCQGFSTSNQRTRSSKNSSNWLCFEFLRIVEVWRPHWVVFENVKGIAETEHGYFFNLVVDSLTDRGYSVASWKLNAAYYGVPQNRWRIFIVGALDCEPPLKPCVTHTPSKHITVRNAISDLPELPNGASNCLAPYRHKARSLYAQLMRGNMSASANHTVTQNSPLVVTRYSYIPQGGNWEDIPPHLMNNYKDRTRCHTGIYHRLMWDKPSIVLGNYRKNMLIHPDQDRGLSVREAARLQSFPDTYVFKGSIGFQQQQVGNSVPPLLAKAVFESIIQADISSSGPANADI